MGNKLYVGNLPYSVRDGDLNQAFSSYGSVTSAKVMMERDTGRSKGFGFVEMASDAEAQAAITGMHGKDMGGLRVYPPSHLPELIDTFDIRDVIVTLPNASGARRRG